MKFLRVFLISSVLLIAVPTLGQDRLESEVEYIKENPITKKKNQKGAFIKKISKTRDSVKNKVVDIHTKAKNNKKLKHKIKKAGKIGKKIIRGATKVIKAKKAVKKKVFNIIKSKIK